MRVTIQPGTMQAVAINCRCHTQLMYCEAAYGGQMSDACLAQLPSPLTTSLMGVGVADFWYPVSGMMNYCVVSNYILYFMSHGL